MRVGLFGGSFDPPHAGHVHAAETARRQFGLDRVWWLVSPQNPLKTRAPAPVSERLEAVRAILPGPRHVATDLEARIGARTTYETVAALQARHPHVRFVWIAGADALAGLHRWSRWRALAAAAPFIIVARAENDAASLARARLAKPVQTFPGALQCGPPFADPARLEHPPAFFWIGARLDRSSSTRLRLADKSRNDRGPDEPGPSNPSERANGEHQTR